MAVLTKNSATKTVSNESLVKILLSEGWVVVPEVKEVFVERREVKKDGKSSKSDNK